MSDTDTHVPLPDLNAADAPVGDDIGYRDYRDHYRDMARSLGFEGHIAWAEAMT